MICKKCGAEIKSSLKFCNKCGAKVVLEEPKASSPLSSFITTPVVQTPINENTPQNTISETIKVRPEQTGTVKTQPLTSDDNFSKEVFNRSSISGEKLKWGILRLTVKDSANPLAVANGSIYRFVIDSKEVVTLIAGKGDVSTETELSCGEHNISLEVYSYDDTKLTKPPIHTVNKQNFQILDGQTIHIVANRSGVFGSQTMTQQAPISVDNITPDQTKTSTSTKPIVPLKPKNKVVAGLLAIFLGFLGIHWFYLGKPLRAIVYIVAYLFFPYVWFLYIVEGIFFFCANKDVFDKYRSKW